MSTKPNRVDDLSKKLTEASRPFLGLPITEKFEGELCDSYGAIIDKFLSNINPNFVINCPTNPADKDMIDVKITALTEEASEALETAGERGTS